MRLLYAFAGLVIPCIAKPLPEEPQQLRNRDIKFRVEAGRAAAVKEVFQFAWNGYYKNAFPADELQPLSPPGQTAGYSRNGWGATAIDALSTATIMELPEIVNTIVNYVPTINYSRTVSPASDQVSVFETTIRYLGGMLAGYDLLDGPFSHLVSNSSLVAELLNQSKKLADNLAFSFDTPSGIPDNTINLNTGTRSGFDTGLAVAGSLVLEWTRLSDLTGDPKYANLTQKAEEYLLRPQFQPPAFEPFPGLLGSSINITSGKFMDTSGGWVGGSDSFYEYLIKMYVYDAIKFGEYRDRWMVAADSSIKYLGSHPSSRPDLTFMASYDNAQPSYYSEHLACFAGGNFLLGGMVLGEQKYIDFGLALTAGCHDTYISTATRIGPEIFRWLPAECSASNTTTTYKTPTSPLRARKLSAAANSPYPASYEHVPEAAHPTGTATASTRYSSPNCTPNSCNYDASTSSDMSGQANCALPTDSQAFYQKSGFWVDNSQYDLRPEVLESYYYAYRMTGDTKYQDWAWDAFVAINKTCSLANGFSSVQNVNVVGGGGYGNNQESFFFAEVLKYAYMIFAEDGPWQVNHRGNGRERFVFNTEAHPMRTVFPPF